MEVYEITGYQKGVSREGVNFLQPADSFQNIKNGYIYRQVLQSRRGFNKFSTGYLDAGNLPTRVMGIFENILTATNTVETLAFDKDYLYVYNDGTNAFDRVNFSANILAKKADFTFNLSSNEDYISGTTYPKKDGSQQFVFTGKGMSTQGGISGVYFYDGTEVGDYTDNSEDGDNEDYVPFNSGSGDLSLDKATHVFWFGERINFVAPTLAAKFYAVGMLYSAIRDSDGHGDNFNFSGAGLLQLDSYEHIRGASILGNRISLNLTRSNWIIEKTRDAFNPYFSRKVPSVLGTDASFSMVSWNDEVRSVGKTGVLSTDGRQSLRVDNKIPYFTVDNIYALEFEQTYGGFDRITSQFLWAYVDGSSGSTTQDKVLVNNYEEKSWSVYDMRFSCFGETINGQNLVWDDIYEGNNSSWARWDTTEEIWNKIGLNAQVQKTLAGDDLGFIYQLNQDFDDYFVEITGITAASQAVISTDNQALMVGDKVFIAGVVGMVDDNGTSINDIQPLVTDRTLGTITVDIDTNNFTAYDSGGTISKFIKFEAELVPFNPYRDKGLQCRISHIEFLLDTDGGHLYVDLLQDGNTSPFKSNVLLETTTILKDREWISISVNNTVDFLTLVMKQESVSAQVRLTSVRIHCEPAGMTTD